MTHGPLMASAYSGPVTLFGRGSKDELAGGGGDDLLIAGYTAFDANATDYTLAQTCALQLWVRSQRDPAQTMKDYNALCRRGGEAPFQALAKGAGLISPFEPGCLRDVVAQARSALAN